jgi:hypothetical protein
MGNVRNGARTEDDMSKGMNAKRGGSEKRAPEALSIEELEGVAGGSVKSFFKGLGKDLLKGVEAIPGVGAVVKGAVTHQPVKTVVKNFFTQGAELAAGGPETGAAKVAASVAKSTVGNLVKGK